MATNDLASNRNMIRDGYETLPSLPAFESEQQNSLIETASACGGSIFGESTVSGSAFGSAIGHDDPTAIMGNVVRSETPDVVPSFSTANESLLQFDPDDDIEARDHVDENCQGLRKASSVDNPRTNIVKDLKLQLSELDRTEEQWQAKMSLRTSSPTDLDATDDPYMDEVGTAEISPTGRIQSRHFEQLCGQFIDDRNNPPKLLGEDSSIETELSLPEPNSPADLKNATDELSTDLSLTSSASDAGILKKNSDDTMSQSTAIATDTEKIARQVQKRLVGSHKEGGERSDDDDMVVHKLTSQTSTHRYGRWKQWIPIGEEEQRSKIQEGRMASKSDLSEDEDSNSKVQDVWKLSKRWVVIVLALLLLVAGITALGLSLPSKESKSTDRSSFQHTSSPSLRATFSPTVPLAETPTSSPPSPTQAPTTSPSPKTPSLMMIMQQKLLPISGEALFDESAPQFAAVEWLVHKDPARMELESLENDSLKERYVAALLYFALGGDTWFDQYGFLSSSSVCEWNSVSGMGVFCSGGVIDEIAINENNVQGALPTELSELTALKVFEMRGNGITGSVPSVLGKLLSLEEIDFRQNSLTGTVPESIFRIPNLKKLVLFLNYDLGGSIPSTIGLATNLEMISLQRCRLNGSLPDEMGRLSNLFFVALMENYLTGTIPTGVVSLPVLKVLELSDNLLTGSIPAFRGQDELYFLSLFNNLLEDNIPSSMGLLPALLFLDLRGNELQGTIPLSLGMLPNLVTFFASNNQLTGPIPSFSGNLDMLRALSFAHNQFTGNLDNFFSEDGPFLQLSTVDFGNNNLNGTIPTTIGKFTAMTDLILKQNQLHGTIPLEIGTMTELDTLSLHSNNLKGEIPETIGMLENIIFLELGSNVLTGPVPGELHLLREARVIVLGPNKLTGTVPPNLSSLKMLDKLWLHNNDLTGDLDLIFCPGGNTSRPIVTFRADCALPSPRVVCSCCTSCCNHASGICGPTGV